MSKNPERLSASHFLSSCGLTRWRYVVTADPDAASAYSGFWWVSVRLAMAFEVLDAGVC
jgi:hypothetical protein